MSSMTLYRPGDVVRHHQQAMIVLRREDSLECAEPIYTCAYMEFEPVAAIRSATFNHCELEFVVGPEYECHSWLRGSAAVDGAPLSQFEEWWAGQQKRLLHFTQAKEYAEAAWVAARASTDTSPARADTEEKP